MTKKKTKQKIDWRVIATGLVCLTIIECVALMQGINGKLFSLIAGIIGLAIGVTIKNPIKQ